MGMYTSIAHPKDGRELQIKTGSDECQNYKVGDEIPWSPDPYWPGDHIDGAYRSYSDNGYDDWVIIKNRIVQEVVVDEDDLSYSSLESEFNIQPPPRSLWSDEAWERYDKIKRETHKEFEDHIKAIEKNKDRPVTTMEHLGAAMAFPLTRTLNFVSLADKILNVQPLTAPKGVSDALEEKTQKKK